MKKIMKYFSKHPSVNALSHLSAGVGIGVLLTHVFFDPHPMRWGLFFIALGVAGHLYAYMSKK